MSKRWTAEELVDTALDAPEYLANINRGGNERTKALTALAKAWGLEVADDPLPTKLLTSPMPGGHFRVHDESGKTWLIVDVVGHLGLLHDMIGAWYEKKQPKPIRSLSLCDLWQEGCDPSDDGRYMVFMNSPYGSVESDFRIACWSSSSGWEQLPWPVLAWRNLRANETSTVAP